MAVNRKNNDCSKLSLSLHTGLSNSCTLDTFHPFPENHTPINYLIDWWVIKDEFYQMF
jgi:hypothetical protein